MAEPIITETKISINKPITIIVEQKEKEKKDENCDKCFGMSSLCVDLLKWVIGTLILGIIGNIISCQHNESQSKINNAKDSIELVLKRMDTDSKLMEAVSAKYVPNDTSERRYLQFLQTFITTDSLKKAVNNRIAVLNSELLAKDAFAFDKQNNQIEENTNLLPQNKRIEYMIRADSIPRIPKSMKAFKETDIKLPILDNGIANIDSLTIAKIQHTKLITVPQVAGDDYVLTGTPQTLWCKPGYYCVFNNTLRIYVKSLEKNNGIVADITYDQTNKSIESNKAFAIGEQKSYILEDGNKYIINLDYIGAAGRNPFTKAAYMTVTIYKRTTVN